MPKKKFSGQEFFFIFEKKMTIKNFRFFSHFFFDPEKSRFFPDFCPDRKSGFSGGQKKSIFFAFFFAIFFAIFWSIFDPQKSRFFFFRKKTGNFLGPENFQKSGFFSGNFSGKNPKKVRAAAALLINVFFGLPKCAKSGFLHFFYSRNYKKIAKKSQKNGQKTAIFRVFFTFFSFSSHCRHEKNPKKSPIAAQLNRKIAKKIRIFGPKMAIFWSKNGHFWPIFGRFLGHFLVIFWVIF